MGKKQKKQQPVDGLLLLYLVASILLGAGVISAVGGDIAAGVLRSAPETGWGVAIAFFMLGPPLLVGSFLTAMRLEKIKKTQHPAAPTVKVASIVSLVLLAVYTLYYFFNR